jgi:hypothetical protein
MLADYLESHPGKPGTVYSGPRFRKTANGVALLSNHNSCECCGASRENEFMVIDHDHETVLVRGVLCNACNGWLGSYRDNIAMMRRYAEILRTPSMPNPGAAEQAEWDRKGYTYSSHPEPISIEIEIPAFVFEFTDDGKTLTVTVNGKSEVKHRRHPMAPLDKRKMIARLKTKGTVYWEGQVM